MVGLQNLRSNSSGCNPVVTLEVPFINPLFSCGLVQSGPFTCDPGARPARACLAPTAASAYLVALAWQAGELTYCS